MTHARITDRRPRTGARLAWVVASAVFTAIPICAQHGQFPAVVDEGATIDPQLGEKASLELTFIDDRAQPFVLADHLTGERPILLNLGYYSCPGMCGFVLNTFLDKLKDSGVEPGRDFDLWTISIDHTEGTGLAHDKKRTYVEALAQQAAIERHAEHSSAPAWTSDWPFLTGDETSIRALTDSVGWRFRKEPDSNVYDHPPSLVLLSPDGVVSRYLDARFLTPATLRSAVIEAGDGKVGTFVERLLVSCLTFDPRTHAYSMTAMTVMRIGGVITLLALGGMIFFLWRRERARHRPVEATT